MRPWSIHYIYRLWVDRLNGILMSPPSNRRDNNAKLIMTIKNKI